MTPVASIRRGGRSAWPPPGRTVLAAALAAVLGGPAAAGDPGPGFEGRLRVEVLDDVDALWNLQLLEDFAFRDSRGKRWHVPGGTRVSGAMLPEDLLAQAPRLPLGQVRRAAVLRDHFLRAQTEPWRAVARLFHEANVADAVEERDAKVLYALWYAGGLRWEVKATSSCFGHCHIAAPELAWKPDLDGVDLAPVADWIWREDPSLDRIDAELDQRIARPGPHVFAQPRRSGPTTPP